MRRFAKPLYGLTPVPRVRIPPSPPASLNCREIPPPFPRNARNMPRISRLFAHKPDCRERTARQRRGSRARLFSGGHTGSPVSKKALGECNAIRSRKPGQSELTFVDSRERGSALPVGRFRITSCLPTIHSEVVFGLGKTAGTLSVARLRCEQRRIVGVTAQDRAPKQARLH
jgi:hypothetical protein